MYIYYHLIAYDNNVINAYYNVNIFPLWKEYIRKNVLLIFLDDSKAKNYQLEKPEMRKKQSSNGRILLLFNYK